MADHRLILALKALRQMGIRPLALYAWYQLGLRTGYFRRRTPPCQLQNSKHSLRVSKPLYPLPSREDLTAVLGDRAVDLFAEADEIVSGKIRLFGAEPRPLVLEAPVPLKHWTFYEKGLDPAEGQEIGKKLQEACDGIPLEAVGDIKFLWEPGRFGWVYPLGRAFYISGEERYAQAFWKYTEAFLSANPVNMGPHWSSAQEVALRLIAMVFAAHVFSDSAYTTAQRMASLAQAVASHAARIPLTLAYSRSQNNNHLLTEAAGLYTAGVFLADHPSSASWRKLGWRWLHHGLRSQIAPDGAYVQNSANYHRLMLQIALWVYQLAKAQREPFPESSARCLGAATRWLLALIDRNSGHAPNLGPNDGAYIFPFTVYPFSDYRPVLQAACQAFLGRRPFPAGPWDEMSLWFGTIGKSEAERWDMIETPNAPKFSGFHPAQRQTPHILRSPSGDSWAYFRVARHYARPGHADQLHLDLWWRGWNIARDAGTFLYNASPPWENALASTFVHNTVTVDGQEQMLRVGRFLWLDWAQGEVLFAEPADEETWKSLLARHNGYRRLGIIHQRQVTVLTDEHWSVLDTLDRLPKYRKDTRHISRSTVRLHWLLPDWPWKVFESQDSGVELHLESPIGPISIRIQTRPGLETPSEGSAGASQRSPLVLQIVRGGKLLYGVGQVSSTWGWYSPSYGQRVPALSLSALAEVDLPCTFISEWIFPT